MRDGSEAQADGGGAESSKAASKADLVEEAFDPPSPTPGFDPPSLTLCCIKAQAIYS